MTERKKSELAVYQEIYQSLILLKNTELPESSHLKKLLSDLVDTQVFEDVFERTENELKNLVWSNYLKGTQLEKLL